MRDGVQLGRSIAKAAKRGPVGHATPTSTKKVVFAREASDDDSESSESVRHSSTALNELRGRIERDDEDEDEDEDESEEEEEGESDEEEEDDEEELDEEDEEGEGEEDDSQYDDDNSSYSSSSSSSSTDDDDNAGQQSTALHSGKKASAPARPQFDSNVPLFQLMQQVKSSSSASPSSEHPGQSRNRANRKRPKREMEDHQQANSDEKPKRNKHAPTEMRSDKPVRRLRVDADNSVRKSVDPRFADFTGQLDQRHFAKNYSFLEDYRQQEIDTLSKALKKTKNPARVQDIKSEIVKLKQQLKERQHAVRVMSKIDAITQQEKEKVRAGIKKPFFLKNSAKKEIALDDKFRELKKDGKLKKYMERKQKKQDSKGRQFMPLTRRDA